MPPSLSAVSSTSIVQDELLSIPVTVAGDRGNLVLSAVTSNNTVIPLSAVTYSLTSGAAGSRTVNIQASKAIGITSITLTLTDSFGTAVNRVFGVTVNGNDVCLFVCSIMELFPLINPHIKSK